MGEWQEGAVRARGLAAKSVAAAGAAVRNPELALSFLLAAEAVAVALAAGSGKIPLLVVTLFRALLTL
jgi:hypothetical protein